MHVVKFFCLKTANPRNVFLLLNLPYFVRINAGEYSHVVSLLSLSSKMMQLPSARKF